MDQRVLTPIKTGSPCVDFSEENLSSLNSIRETDLGQNVYTLKEVLQMNTPEKTTFKLANNSAENHRFIQIRLQQVDKNQLIVIVHDITDSIKLQNTEE